MFVLLLISTLMVLFGQQDGHPGTKHFHFKTPWNVDKAVNVSGQRMTTVLCGKAHLPPSGD